MIKGIALAASLGASLLVSAAWACTPPRLPPELPGESSDAYWARVERHRRHEVLAQAKLRVADGLRSADQIFIAQDTIWQPPARPLPVRRKAKKPVQRPSGGSVVRPQWKSVAPPPIDRTDFGSPSYFVPVDWIRGTPSGRPFTVQRSASFCGPESFGDTSHSQPGDRFLFFARKGPVSEATLIDAIALDSIDHPALTAFVAKYRKRPAARR